MMVDVKKLLKKNILFAVLSMVVLSGKGQIMSSENLVSMTALAKPKLQPYILKKGFRYSGKDQVNDTTYTIYQFAKAKKIKDSIIDSSVRVITVFNLKDAAGVNYQTSELDEFKELVKEFKKDGFYCNKPEDSLGNKLLLYQHNDVIIHTYFTISDGIKLYNIAVFKKMFPNPKDVNYADDLLAFTSHEYLVYYFGKTNVKNDVYFFSENEVNRCSVLFLNTDRQVVYIWKDDVNKCTIDHLLFGGQQKLASVQQSDKFVAENNWLFKSGIHAGMSLFELRKLNENDFKFYGANSVNSGLILPENTGKLDFKKENVILSCVNCRDDKFSSAAVIDSNDALAEEKILFVLTIALNAENAASP